LRIKADFAFCFGFAQRLALPACGRAWEMFESRKSPKPEKCLKMPQNPTRQVHALLGAIELKTRWLKKNTTAKLTRFLHTTLTLATTKNLTCQNAK